MIPQSAPNGVLLDHISPLARRVALAGNAPLRFDDPTRAALVIDGKVELFLAALQGDEPTGARHHFTTVEPGGLIFGIEPGLMSEGIALLAVAPIGTEVLELAAEEVERIADESSATGDVAAALDLWIHALMRGIAQWVDPRPEIHLSIAAGESGGSLAGRRFTTRGGVGWARVVPDATLLLDMEELPDTGSELLFPLSPEGWLMTLGEQRVRVETTADVLRMGSVWGGLKVLHQLVLDLAAMNLRLANADEHNRLKARVEATAAKRLEGFRGLLSAVDVRPLGVEIADAPPLIAAVRLIGRIQGFEVRLPQSSGNDQDLSRVDLADLARASGFRVRLVRPSQAWWRSDFGALLAFDRDSGRPLVLHMDMRGRALVSDPEAAGPRRFNPKSDRIREVAYELTGPLPYHSMKTGSLFRHALVRRGRDLAATLATTGLLGILGLAVPVATGYMIDQVIPDHEIGRLVEMGIILAVFAFTSFILTLVGALAYARLEAHLGITLQTGLMDRMLRLPMIFFRDHSAGDLASRVGAIALIQRLISAASANAILSGIFSLLSLLLLFVYDARLALWASVAVAIYFVGSAIIMFLRVREERPVAAISGEINSVLLQLILGVSKIRLAAAEDRAFSRWAILFARENRHRLRAELLGAAQGTLNQVLGLSGLVLLAIAIGKPSAQPSLIALGSFAAMLTAYQRFASGITQASQALTQLLAVQPQIERLRPLLAQAAEAAERLDPPGTLSGAIEVSHLSFRYTPDGPIILEDVCLEASPGEMIALVGPSGSGKSTLLRLLLGFETPRNGAILFDGKALVGLDKAAVRRQMGVVMQNSQPMPGSLYENIAGTTGCSLDEAWEAAERAGLADDIRAMPMGMHTVVLEGGGALSGGQMQRLMIARAIVSKPRILLLDEATSALDNRVQAVVTESLDRLSITRVVVAHRLSTVINADRIYVLERGRITESGSYLELMALGGVFAQLAERQMA